MRCDCTMQDIKKKYGSKVVDLVIRVRRELNEYCPSAFYPGTQKLWHPVEDREVKLSEALEVAFNNLSVVEETADEQTKGETWDGL